jgi:putative ABC transport system permease protein
MSKPALTWASAAKIAWRELQASKEKFLFVIFSVAVGVAALTGVRGFSDSFQSTLLGEARSVMAGDLQARMFRQPNAAEETQLNAMASRGVERTEITEMISMASAAGGSPPVSISLKVVDPSKYPFYGKVDLSPAMPLGEALTNSTIVVADDLLIRLHDHVGDSVRIGDSIFRIAAVIVREPDRIGSGMGLGPRVMMARSALEKSGLVQVGSRAGERLLFKLPQGGTGIADARAELEQVLPDAQITDFRETSPALSDGLNRSTGILSLLCLVAMVLGAVGVAMAMRAHLQQRVEVLAIMKSIGARSSDILRIYLLQTVLLGFAGGVIGVLFGLGVERAFPLLLGHLLMIQTHFSFPWRSVFGGLSTGVLTTLLFCLPPLLDIRKVRPNLVLRRTVEADSDGDEQGGLRRLITRLNRDKAQWIAILVILAGLSLIAAALSDNAVIGRWFAAGLSALLVVTLGAAALTLRVIRSFLDRTRLGLRAYLRQGLANLYRPGNQSSAVLAALGIGVMLILTVFVMQDAAVARMQATASPNAPNVFLVDISTSELAGVRDLLVHQPGVRGAMEALPVVSGRIVALDGTPVDSLRVKNYPRRMLRSVTLTWSRDLPEGAEVVGGKWSNAADGESMAVTEGVARRLHLQPGSEVDLLSNDKPIHAKVTALIKQDGEHIYSRSEFILSPAALAGFPVIWYGAVHVDSKHVGELQRALYDSFPTVTTVNIADVLETIQGVVGQITLVIRFLAGFSILAGVIILASSIASTRFRRIREVVVLKTLGAKRGHIAAVFTVEFVVLGLLAGAIGAVFANLLSRVLLHRLDVAFHVEWLASGLAIAGTAALAAATGWIASFRILGQKPLQVLREE